MQIPAVNSHLLCEAHIIVSHTRNFGHIIESNTKACKSNIFDIYDMPLSELEYIKREILSSDSMFAALTQSGNVLVFSRLGRSAYIMGVVCVSLEKAKHITDVFNSFNTSPTLTRRLRKCCSDVECESICELLMLFADKQYYEDLLGEFIYKSILEYASVYNFKINVSITRALESSPIGAVMCKDMLCLFLHYLFIVATKSNSDKIDIRIVEISDRLIIHSEINTNNTVCDTNGLDTLELIANSFSVSLKYSSCGGKMKISVCPYFIDDSQHGLKSKIQFDF